MALAFARTTQLNAGTLARRGARMRWVALLVGLIVLVLPAWAHAEVMDKEPALSTIWTWAILGGALGASCWAVRSWLAWPLTMIVAMFFVGLWAEITDPFIGPAIRAEAGAGYVPAAGVATAFAAGLQFVGLLGRRPSAGRGWRRFLRRNNQLMAESDFNAVQRLLRLQHFIVAAARYDPLAFGSWVVQVTTSPPLRIVWDGKEGWLILQEETEQVFAGARVWRGLWIAKSKSQPTPEDAVAAILSHIGGA